MADTDDEPQCESCRSTGVPLQTFERGYGQANVGGTRTLCQFCHSSEMSIVDQYPRQFDRGVITIGKIICYVGNEILKELRKR